MSRLLLLPLFVIQSIALFAEDAPREWQMLEHYVTLMDADPGTCTRLKMPQGQRINAFLSYTAIGTDYGFLGPGERSIAWEPGHVCVQLDETSWGGLWHSLAGQGKDPNSWMDFDKVYPPFIQDAYQPKVVGLRLRGHGKGTVKLEIKDAAQTVLWSDHWKLNSESDADFTRPLPMLHRAKYLNWVGESGCHMCLDHIALEIQMPKVSTDLRVFLKSFVKLSRCYNERSGFVKDRAHADDGAFDSIPACGMFCLAAAVANEQGIVARDFAETLLKQTQRNVSLVPSASGLLPHFVYRSSNGGHVIHPHTIFSTVDSAIYYHAMLLAAQILHDTETCNALLKTIKNIPMRSLLDSDGYVIHGITDDGQRINASWKDWGGETALVLAFERLAVGDETMPKMRTDGKAWQSTGFIPEIQSLFFPGFDRETPDLVSQQNWLALRRDYLRRQRDYFASSELFGLSAGEARRGIGYLVSGTDLKDQSIIHPHYMLMSASLWPDSNEACALMERLERIGALQPWGMVENIDTKTKEMLPMIGSLNAGFEALAAYHLLIKHRNGKDAIYDGAQNQAELAGALKIFYH